MREQIRVLVIDDSRTMQAILKFQLEQDPGIKVVGMAANPLAAREAINATKPDVLTLDINMPGMGGLEFLERLMKIHPMPVVIVSSLVNKYSEVALDALTLGAFDCFLKPVSATDATAYDELRSKIRATKSSPLSRQPQHNTERGKNSDYVPGEHIVALGASTGGVDALLQILAAYPRNCPPTVITQHMPKSFTKTFAKRLDENSDAVVEEARNGVQLKTGTVYLAPGGDAHLEVTGRTKPLCRLREGELVSGHRPSVDVLFRSVARSGRKAVGVILTGMGDDGTQGLLEMRNAGARTLGQDKSSSLVYGMPRVAFEAGAVEKQVPLAKVSTEIMRLTSKSAAG